MATKKYLILLLAFILIMGIVTIFGENGLLHVHNLKRQLEKLSQTNESIRFENDDLREEIQNLREHKEYIELQAHKQGLVGEGEIIFQFKENR